MKTAVERLFPFALRANILVVGRHNLLRCRKRLQFVLITHDISANSRQEIVRDYAALPIVQCFRSMELEEHFDLHNTKVLGFRKSSLAVSILRELKPFRLKA